MSLNKKKLNIKVGSKYYLTINIDVCDGLTNGTECAVQEIDYRVAYQALFG